MKGFIKLLKKTVLRNEIKVIDLKVRSSVGSFLNFKDDIMRILLTLTPPSPTPLSVESPPFRARDDAK
jgi:hypothetical protein